MTATPEPERRPLGDAEMTPVDMGRRSKLPWVILSIFAFGNLAFPLVFVAGLGWGPVGLPVGIAVSGLVTLAAVLGLRRGRP